MLISTSLHFNKRVLVSCFPSLQLKEVVLNSGKVLRADVCIIGTGKGTLTSMGVRRHAIQITGTRGYIVVAFIT